MGKNKDAAIGFGVIAVIIAVIVGVVLAVLPEEPETVQNELEEIEPAKEEKLDTEEEVWEFVSNYRGVDGSGDTLSETLAIITIMTYGDENIFENPSTSLSITAFPDYEMGLTERYWRVTVSLETYADSIEYVWVVDTETDSVYAGNDDGKVVLDILDMA